MIGGFVTASHTVLVESKLVVSCNVKPMVLAGQVTETRLVNHWTVSETVSMKNRDQLTAVPPGPHNQAYLDTKRDRQGHLL